MCHVLSGFGCIQTPRCRQKSGGYKLQLMFVNANRQSLKLDLYITSKTRKKKVQKKRQK